jgi:hypothetical protein
MIIDLSSISEVDDVSGDSENESTEFKLVVLASQCPDGEENELLDVLLSCEGVMLEATKALSRRNGNTSLRFLHKALAKINPTP